jgi:hypothetical protein
MNTSNPLQLFTCFPKLPIELRLKIWKEALPGPRILPVECRFNFVQGIEQKHFIVTTPPPVAFHVSRESRQEALKKYTSRLDTTSNTSNFWIGPVNDTIYMAWPKGDYIIAWVSDWFQADVDKILSLIQHFAIDSQLFVVGEARNIAIYFAELKTLTWVLHDPKCEQGVSYNAKTVTFADGSGQRQKNLQQAGPQTFAESSI